jgi:hypothetical protein
MRVAFSPADRTLDVDELTTVIEDFNAIFIRLPAVRRFNFSTLSVLHTLSRNGPLRRSVKCSLVQRASWSA